MILPPFKAIPTQLPHPPKSPSPNSLLNQTHSTFSTTNSNTNQSLSLRHTTKYTDPIVAWTTSIADYCKSGHLVKAASKFVQMREAAIEPNHITFITLLSACAHYPARTNFSFGTAIHAHVRKLGLDINDVLMSWWTLH
ncbi:Pentatricopeptide repeat-containing protein, chloroplastic [Glycine max]|nr:Pentatricopeptide repeat-containing protein, chloroplastic [Glycine max]